MISAYRLEVCWHVHSSTYQMKLTSFAAGLAQETVQLSAFGGWSMAQTGCACGASDTALFFACTHQLNRLTLVNTRSPRQPASSVHQAHALRRMYV